MSFLTMLGYALRLYGEYCAVFSLLVSINLLDHFCLKNARRTER